MQARIFPIRLIANPLTRLDFNFLNPQVHGQKLPSLEILAFRHERWPSITSRPQQKANRKYWTASSSSPHRFVKCRISPISAHLPHSTTDTFPAKFAC
jgi:hypothetical protein